MLENAKQNFWNGATPPLGYKIIEAERRGQKIEKKLDVDPVEQEIMHLIYPSMRMAIRRPAHGLLECGGRLNAIGAWRLDMRATVTPRVSEILSWIGVDSAGTLTNLARLLNHGRLAATGKLVNCRSIRASNVDRHALRPKSPQLTIGTITSSSRSKRAAYAAPP